MLSARAPSPRRCLADQGGYAMAIVMFVLLTVSALSAAAYVSADGDLGLNQRDADGKRAFAAAEAGVAFYLGKLADDNRYWTRCTNVPAGADGKQPVTQWWAPGTSEPRTSASWKRIPRPAGETGPRAEYTIELIPTLIPGSDPPQRRPACVENDQTSMIDLRDGTFTIRSTGRYGPPGREVKRSVLATFRRKSFLDYVYANVYETMDPVLLQAAYPSVSGLGAWAATSEGCASYRRDGREDHVFPGNGGRYCYTINYARTDEMNGPFHTNDGVNIETCGQTRFGRPGRADAVEFWDSRSGSTSCMPDVGTSSVAQGSNYQQLNPPASNTELANTALAAYRFSGETDIVLNGTSMTVTRPGVAPQTMALPSNGVISVLGTGGACPGYDVANPNAAQPACGTAKVRGTYASDLTITTKGDIVVTGDLRSQSDAVLGLVATKFLRVARGTFPNPCDWRSTDTTPAGDRIIEAAMLSIEHVFTVDSYWCGDDNGYVRIRGSIAQRFRGRTANANPGDAERTAYNKDYSYDDRLRYRSPPFFLTPNEAAWRVSRTREQTDAR